MKCTTLVNMHNHQLISTQLAHLNARYRQFNNEMMQDLKFFTECKAVVNLAIIRKSVQKPDDVRYVIFYHY